MGSSASVRVLNVAIFAGLYFGGVALRGHQVAARLRQRVHWKSLSCVPTEVPERAAN
jgi:hypothetical protein